MNIEALTFGILNYREAILESFLWIRRINIMELAVV